MFHAGATLFAAPPAARGGAEPGDGRYRQDRRREQGLGRHARRCERVGVWIEEFGRVAERAVDCE